MCVFPGGFGQCEAVFLTGRKRKGDDRVVAPAQIDVRGIKTMAAAADRGKSKGVARVGRIDATLLKK